MLSPGILAFFSGPSGATFTSFRFRAIGREQVPSGRQSRAAPRCEATRAVSSIHPRGGFNNLAARKHAADGAKAQSIAVSVVQQHAPSHTAASNRSFQIKAADRYPLSVTGPSVSPTIHRCASYIVPLALLLLSSVFRHHGKQQGGVSVRYPR